MLLAAAGNVLPLHCAWHSVTGWPCPGCGTTRSFLCLIRGQWLEALVMNPGAVLGVLVLIVLNFYAASVLLFRFEPCRLSCAWRGWRWLVAVSFAANWVYLLVAGRV